MKIVTRGLGDGTETGNRIITRGYHAGGYIEAIWIVVREGVQKIFRELPRLRD
jgi:hypothetical protein